MKLGYIAIQRKIQDHKFYKEKREYSKFEAWFDLLLEAQYRKEPKEVIIGMKVLIQNYGEILRSIKGWAQRWRWGRTKVYRYFKLLQRLEQIRYTNETVTTRITILNYKKYNLNETQVEHKWNAKGTQPDNTELKVIKDKKELPKKEPFRLPDIDEIEDTAFPKVKSDLDKICQELYDKKIFTKVHAFRNTMLKSRKNERAILHALSRCYLKNTLKPFKNDSEAWAYCIKIIQAEDGNYNEKDHNKTN